MTTDFSGPEGRATPIEDRMREASAIADANQGICLGEVPPLKTIAEPCDFISTAARKSRNKSRAGENYYRHAIHGLTEAAVGMARDKNVAATFDECASIARVTVNNCDAAAVYGISKCHPAPIARAAAIINRLLDIHAATQVIYFLRSVEGYDQLDSRQVMKQAEAWMHEIALANHTGDMRYRWPDPVSMVTDYYRTRCSGPVSIRYPDGRPVSTGYFFDRLTCGHVVKLAEAAKPPVSNIPLPTMRPQIVRCPAFDRTTGSLIPEGRLAKTLPDGAVCTSWWRNGKLHRDPKAGPAWHRKGPDGEITDYIVAGNLHRDPIEGAAVSSWNPDGTLAFEEFWQEGKRLQTDESTEAADA